jgi:hypothetical protein
MNAKARVVVALALLCVGAAPGRRSSSFLYRPNDVALVGLG